MVVKKKKVCRLSKYYYRAKDADSEYKEFRTNSRIGIRIPQEEIYEINNVITPLVKKGQTTNHLYINHPEVLNFSKVSFYNYINAGVFEFGSLDFSRIVKHKKRKNKKRRTRQEREILVDRKYTDFIKFTSRNPEFNIVEIDTVEGLKTDSKCILTRF